MSEHDFQKSKTLLLFEKEKGGVGSTGSLVTIAHHLSRIATPVVLVEASKTQNDVRNAYYEWGVEELDLDASDSIERLIDIVDDAAPGAFILVNVPGGKAETLDEAHQTIAYAVETGQLNCKPIIVWTMGRDAASRSTLDTVMEGDLPGPIYLNLPEWFGPPEKFDLFDDALEEAIRATGGHVFCMPALKSHIYDEFRTNEVAIHDIKKAGTLGKRIFIDAWEKRVAGVLEGLF